MSTNFHSLIIPSKHEMLDSTPCDEDAPQLRTMSVFVREVIAALMHDYCYNFIICYNSHQVTVYVDKIQNISCSH